MAVNKKKFKTSYFRILKFMLIGIIPNIFLYYFLADKLPPALTTILSMLIFIAVGFIGEAIYVKIRNKQLIQEQIEIQQQKLEQKKKREGKK